MAVDPNTRELLKKLGFDEETMKAADAVTDKHQRISKSKLIVREMLYEIVAFIRDNKETILPYAREAYSVINETKTDDEMLVAYLNYIIRDFKSGAEITLTMAQVLGFDAVASLVEKERIKREEEIAADPNIEMI